ncbi:MAG: hypothetical protein QT02_C0007G0004 [archaeon GW2011_AR9]|nr:MAG: hypothetical protein QT02_C0007G0004 [archaeon GW2011_AR9]HIG93081.1 50S ribosomal protein L30 [Candidatus Woesearchaeota archaeon]
MAKKKDVGEELKVLRQKVQDGKAIVGKERVLKQLKSGTLSKVFLSSNCPEKVKEDIQYYAQLAKIPVIELEQNNVELGLFCKKNYFISVVGSIGE